MVNFKIELTENDIFNFSYANWKAHDNKSLRTNYFVKTFFYSFLGASIIFPIKTLLFQKPVTDSDILIFILIIFFAFFVSCIYIKQGFHKNSRKMIENPLNRNFFLTTEININNSGIEANDSVSTTIYKWPGIVKQLETKDYFFLYVNSIQAIIIPKKNLNGEDLKILNNILSTNIPLSVQLKSR